jgi:hypothetical protein
MVNLNGTVSKFVNHNVRNFDLSLMLPTNRDETVWLARLFLSLQYVPSNVCSPLLRRSLSVQSSCVFQKCSWLAPCSVKWHYPSVTWCVLCFAQTAFSFVTLEQWSSAPCLEPRRDSHWFRDMTNYQCDRRLGWKRLMLKLNKLATSNAVMTSRVIAVAQGALVTERFPHMCRAMNSGTLLDKNEVLKMCAVHPWQKYN